MLRALAALLVFIVCTSDAFANEPTKPKVQWKKGEFIIKLRTGAKEMSTNDLKRHFGTTRLRYLTRNRQVLQIKTAVSEVTEAKRLIHSMKSDRLVAYAEPNFIYHWVKEPDDERFGDLWGLQNRENPGIDIDATKAWEITTGRKEVVVAVIDTGVDYTINDLRPNMWVNEAEKNGKPGVDDDDNGYVDDIYGYDFSNDDNDPKDGHGHGSHVAGTIGAAGNNGEGVVGVNWNVRIMALKFLSDHGSGSTANAIRAIDYATQMGAHIMNNSWGGGGYSKLLEEAIQRANQKNVLFVAAAGNHGANIDHFPFYPAGYKVPNVLAVAAIQSDGKRASFSCYGEKTVGLGAPGVNILSTTPSGLKTFSGTSMATPHAAGVGALVMADNPELQGELLKKRLMETAKPLPSMDGKTISGGIVDAFRALKNITR